MNSVQDYIWLDRVRSKKKLFWNSRLSANCMSWGISSEKIQSNVTIHRNLDVFVFFFHLNSLLLKLLVLKIQTGATFKINFFCSISYHAQPWCSTVAHFLRILKKYYQNLILNLQSYYYSNKFLSQMQYFFLQKKFHLDGFMRNLNFLTK